MKTTLPIIMLFMILLGTGLGLYKESSEEKTTIRHIGTYLSIISLILYLLSFAIGMGATPWTVNSEIYPVQVRGVGTSLATTTNWLSNFVVSFFFLYLLEDVKYGEIICFYTIAGFTVLAFLFVHFLVPETRGKEVNQIVKEICPHYPSDYGTVSKE
jgi:hypothetical protein